MKKIIILIFIFMSSVIFAQDNSDDDIITYEEYMKIIESNLSEIKQQKNQYLQAVNNLKKSRRVYDVEFTTSAKGIGKKEYMDGSQTDLDYSAGFQVDGYLATTLPSGTRIKVGGEYTQLYSWGEATFPDYSTIMTGTIGSSDEDFNTTTWDPVIKISVAQPLIYNFFGYLDRSEIKNARLMLDIAKLKLREDHDLTIAVYQKLYFKWIEYRQKLKYLEKTINNSKRLQAQTQKKAKSGIAENDELQRIRYLVFKYEENYQSLLIGYKQLLNELSYFIDTSKLLPDEEKFDRLFETAINYPVEIINFEDTTASKRIGLMINNLAYNKKLIINQSLPQLNIFTNIDIKFHQYLNQYDNEDIDDDYSAGNGDVDVVAGLEFSYKFGSHKERAEIKEISLQIDDLNYQYNILKRQYNKNINDINELFNSYKKIIELKELNIVSLISRYHTEIKKYNQARLELRDLIDTDNTITEEEIALIDSKIMIINLYFEYLTLVN